MNINVAVKINPPERKAVLKLAKRDGSTAKAIVSAAVREYLARERRRTAKAGRSGQ